MKETVTGWLSGWRKQIIAVLVPGESRYWLAEWLEKTDTNQVCQLHTLRRATSGLGIGTRVISWHLMDLVT